MKLILFADKLPPNIGGMETHAHYFVQYFNKKYDLIIISKFQDIDVIVDTNYKLLKSINLLEYLSAYKNDKVVIFYNSGIWIEQLIEIRNLLPQAIIFYRTGGNEIIKSPLNFDMPIYEERKEFWRDSINNGVNYLITNSDFTDKRLIDFGINKNILKQIAGGIDVCNINNAIKTRDITRNNYGIKKGEKVVVTASRFVPYKRVDFLIESLAKCENDFTLFLAGDGPLENELKEQAKKESYSIKFLGNLSQEDAVNLIAIADVYVQVSCDLTVAVEGGSYIHTEGMGRSLLEAICLGVPVVVTQCGAVGEYINNKNGCLVHTKEELKNAVDKILSKEIKYNIDTNDNIKKHTFDNIFEEYINLWS